MRVEHFLEQGAAARPAKTALVCDGRRLSYCELNEEADRFAALLQDGGVRRGDRVAIYLDNSSEAVVAIFSALKAGAAFVMVNPSVKPAKLSFLLNDCRATALVCDHRRLAGLATVCADTHHLLALFVVGLDADHQEIGASRPKVTPFAKPMPRAGSRTDGIDIDLAALLYTSGSTGQPKGVMMTHLNMVSAAASITTYLENTEADIILNTLPLSFDYGLYQVLLAFRVGATVVLERSFTYPSAVLATLERERVTAFPIVPTIFAILRQLDLSQYDFSSLRYITNTGAAMPVAHVKEMRRLLPHVAIYLMYGLTECKRVSYLPPDQVEARPDSVGRGMPNEEVYIVDESGTRLSAGVGELVIRGANVMAGYWERPEETARVLKPGPLPGERVLYSGDLFRVDGEGYLYFVGRKDDIIKTRGEKVSPREVENVLHSLEGIAQAAVVSVPDPVLGEAIKAVVMLTEDARLTSADIRRFCARHVEDFMVPTIVEVRTSMPTTPSGKIDKKLLRAPIAN